MNHLNLTSVGAHMVSALLTVFLLSCVTAPWTQAADDGKKVKLRKQALEEKRYEVKNKQNNISSASASSSSSSQSDSSGKTRRDSRATGRATNGASAAGLAKGNASSLKSNPINGAQASKASSKARIKVKGDDVSNGRYPRPDDGENSNKATSTTSVTKNGLRITRSVMATDEGLVSTMDVVSKSDEISVREQHDGSIEVRVRSRRKNAEGNVDEKIFSAASRDELKKQSPKLVRRIKAYEKLAGTAKASADSNGAKASGETERRKLDARVDKQSLDANQMLKQHLEKMLQQNGGNPELQNTIRKMIQDID